MIRVLIADDEALVRSGLRMILQAAPDITVVAEACDGATALAAAERHRPDVVLMDVRMPGVDGLTAAQRLAESDHPAKVVMLTTFDLDEYVHTALRAGAVGFLLKDTPPTDLIAAVRTIAAGNAMLAPTVTKRLISAYTTTEPAKAHAARQLLTALTDREHDVAHAVARGLPNAHIGRELHMSEATVKAHVSSLLAKLNLTNRVQAAILIRDAYGPGGSSRPANRAAEP